MDGNTIVTFLVCIIFLFIFGKLFFWPLKSILKLIFNSILGGILIYLINVIGMNFGFHIGLNILTALLVGLLGVPGAALLVILKLILRIKKFYIKIKNIKRRHLVLSSFYAVSYSTVTDFARFRGLSTSSPLNLEIQQERSCIGITDKIGETSGLVSGIFTT